MKTKLSLFSFLTVLSLLITSSGVAARGMYATATSPSLESPLGSAFTYQGRLKDGDIPADGTYNFRFYLWADQAKTNLLGTVPPTGTMPVMVTDGYFSTTLDFGEGAFTGEERWLEIEVNGNPLSPMQALTATPYALFSKTAWTISGNSGTDSTNNYLGTSDNQALELRVNTQRALRLEPGSSPNLVAGYNGNSTTAGVIGAAIGGGGASGKANRVTDNWGTVSGGENNQVGDNTGTLNSAAYATVSGGANNIASGFGAVVGGGGGYIRGCSPDPYCRPSPNQATGGYSVIGGGLDNLASWELAFIGGGMGNTASYLGGVVGGGLQNNNGGEYGFIGGGLINKITDQGFRGVLVGGQDNTLAGGYGFIGSGVNNSINGYMGMVVGGSNNTADGSYSFAAGNRAKAIGNGTFVWADSTDADFIANTDNTFKVRATNGADFEGNNASSAFRIENKGSGDGLRAYANTSNGSNWAAVYALNNGSSPGLYASSSGTYSGYFTGNIYVGGNCTGCTLVYLAYNEGEKVLEAGDLVSASGVKDPLSGSQQPLLSVVLASVEAPGVVGVVQGRAELVESEKDGQKTQSAEAAPGAALSGDYLFITVQGLAQVKVDASAGQILPGQRLTTGTLPGRVRAVQTMKVNGMEVSESAPLLGVALEPAGEEGLVWVLVDPH